MSCNARSVVLLVAALAGCKREDDIPAPRATPWYAMPTAPQTSAVNGQRYTIEMPARMAIAHPDPAHDVFTSADGELTVTVTYDDAALPPDLQFSRATGGQLARAQSTETSEHGWSAVFDAGKSAFGATDVPPGALTCVAAALGEGAWAAGRTQLLSAICKSLARG